MKPERIDMGMVKSVCLKIDLQKRGMDMVIIKNAHSGQVYEPLIPIDFK